MTRARRRRRQRRTDGAPLAPGVAAVLVFAAMLSSTLLIPALRPFFAAVHPGAEGALYLFNAVNMLGALFGAPLLGAIADSTQRRATVLVIAAVLDGALLFLCSLPLSVPVVLALRVVQGACNVGTLALLMSVTTPRGIPVAGGATVAAIAAGVPIGTILLKNGPEVPLQVGAMLPLLVAAVVGALQPAAPPGRRAAGSLVAAARHVLGPGVFVFAERFAIGLFIVPFSLLCHDVRGLDDAMVGRLYSAFLLPFALATGLVPRIALGPVPAVLVGTVAYAGALLAVGRVAATPLVALVLAVGGVGAAMVYAPSLRIAARAVPARASAAMGALQGLGALGMFLGGVLARGIADALTTAPRAVALRTPLDVAAGSLLVLAAIGIVPFVRAARAVLDEDGDRGGGKADDRVPDADDGPPPGPADATAADGGAEGDAKPVGVDPAARVR